MILNNIGTPIPQSSMSMIMKIGINTNYIKDPIHIWSCQSINVALAFWTPLSGPVSHEYQIIHEVEQGYKWCQTGTTNI